MKQIRQIEFEEMDRKESIIYGLTIFFTYVAISAVGSLILMWFEDLL